MVSKKSISVADGTTLEVVQSFPKKMDLHILFVHGYTDHQGRYVELARRCNEKGIGITTFDQRGYGKSEGTRAYIEDVDVYVADLDEVIQKFSVMGVPTILMGVSMGGCIIVRYLQIHGSSTIGGIVLLSPMLEIDPNIAPLLRKISSFLAVVAPRLKTVKLDAAGLSRDPAIVENYLQDPLVYHDGAIVKTGVAFLKAIKEAQSQYALIDLPTLVMHGTADRLTVPAGSEQFIDQISSEDKTFISYAGLYHELLNEPEKEEVYDHLFEWLLKWDRFIHADTGKEMA